MQMSPLCVWFLRWFSSLPEMVQFSPLARGAKPICILGLWDADALLYSHLIILTPCALGGSWILCVYKTPVSMESESSCVFGSLRIQDSSLNGVRVFLCLWDACIILYASSGSILETSPSLGTRPPTTLAWLFPCSMVSPMEWLLCFPDLSSSRSNTGTSLNHTSCDLCEKVKTWEGYLKIHIKISTQLYKAHI